MARLLKARRLFPGSPACLPGLRGRQAAAMQHAY